MAILGPILWLAGVGVIAIITLAGALVGLMVASDCDLPLPRKRDME